MISRRRFGLAVTVALTASALVAGASALAAAGVTHGRNTQPGR